MSNEDENVAVFVRMRPLSEVEIAANGRVVAHKTPGKADVVAAVCTRTHARTPTKTCAKHSRYSKSDECFFHSISVRVSHLLSPPLSPLTTSPLRIAGEPQLVLGENKNFTYDKVRKQLGLAPAITFHPPIIYTIFPLIYKSRRDLCAFVSAALAL